MKKSLQIWTSLRIFHKAINMENQNHKAGFLFPLCSFFKLRHYGEKHGKKACTAADQVGDGFCPEYSVHAQIPDPGQQDSKGNYDQYLSENREKGCFSGFSKSHKGTLGGKL